MAGAQGQCVSSVSLQYHQVDLIYRANKGERKRVSNIQEDLHSLLWMYNRVEKRITLLAS